MNMETEEDLPIIIEEDFDDAPAPAPAKPEAFSHERKDAAPVNEVSSAPDTSRVSEGAERFVDERKDAFLSLDEKQLVWEMLSRDMGNAWHGMDRQAKEQMVKNYTKSIVEGVITMAGGIWGGLSTEEKRKMFRAQFIDKTVPTSRRQSAYEAIEALGTEAEGSEEKLEEFPDLNKWIKDNRAQLPPYAKPAELEALWKTAKAKWQVAAAKARFQKTNKK